MPEVLRFEHVSHAYGKTRVLDDVSFAADAGELLCLLGPSGCGKTTALRLAAGLEELQAGRIAIDRQDVARADRQTGPEDRNVGMVFQDYALFPHLDVLRNVAFGIRADADARRKRALEVLEQVGMSAFAGAYPHTLSGGQQQRVALARALAPKPRLLLLDEPFSGLDARLRAQIRDETLNVVRESGTTTLIVTHDPEEAMYMADRIALMNAGRVEQIGTPVELYARPVSAFAAMFFSSINRLVGEVRGGAVATPFGAVAANGLADGQPVEILIRPEALHVAAAGAALAADSARAEVIGARTLRRATLLHLCFGDFAGTHVHAHARVPGRVAPAVGEHVDVRLDRALSFVFAIDAADARERYTGPAERTPAVHRRPPP